MNCRRCGAPAAFTPTRAENLRRFRDFMLLSGGLLLVAFVTWILNVTIWPWWIGAAALFVASQALMKWTEARWVMCSSGDHSHSYTHYGWVGKKAAGEHLH